MKRLEEDEWRTMFCSPVPSTVHKMCVFYRLWFFPPSTSGVSVRVLRLMFVPGCGGPHEFVNSVSFSHFLSALIPVPPPPPCSVYHLFSSLLNHVCRRLRCWLSTIVSLQPLYPLPLFFFFNVAPSSSSLLPPLSSITSLLSPPPPTPLLSSLP